ncbi:phage tail tip fiber protein [Tritonibacter scottomollicae]|uniref:Uncharacterized protein DUF1983 n=1 Tax=Tritonibacter scottomollicae TaxID=483013 RepID=A0A2T1AID5_TRISK|nr:DUF1983 domain-containing protein [Tritonibacter scottomollicae]PRZ48356.1 uncharacterized protein DUF1983 [Tritonibacter scottomollicae]
MTRFLLILALALWAGPAAADPISTIAAAITTFFGGGAAFAAATAAVLRSLVKAGISLLVAKIQQRKQKTPGIQSSHTTSGGTEPQATVLGRFTTRGHLVYQNSYDENNKWLTHVVELGDVPGASLRRLIIDGAFQDLPDTLVNGQSYPITNKQKDGSIYGYLWFYDGRQTAASPYLTGIYGGAGRPWTPDHILTGTCYAILAFHRSNEVFPNGVPNYAFELDGPPLYDPRQDSTADGSGPQRFGDPGTWAQTANPMVIAYNVLRGITLPDGRIWGGGFDAEDLPFADWSDAMDACDLGIGAETRPQFTAGFEVKFEEPPADFLQELFASANAQIVEMGGYWFPMVGSASAVSAQVGDDDLLVTEQWQHDPFPGLENTFNAVTTTYTSPASLWEASTLESIVKEDWVAEDGRQKLFELRLPMVYAPEQARQLANALLLENRRFRSHRLPLPGEFARLRPLQNIALSLADYGYEQKVFRIIEAAYDLQTLNVSLSLRETDPSDFDPDPGLELPETPHPVGPIAPTDAGVVGFAVAGETVKNDSGAAFAPAIRIVWDGRLSDTCEGLTFQVRLQGQTDEDTISTTNVASGTYRHQPVQPASEYEVRAKAIASRRATAWSVWLPVSTPDVRISPALLDDAVWEAISTDAASVASALDAELTAEVIAPIARDLELRTVEQRTVAEAVGIIGEQVVWAISRLSDVDGRLSDAGIVQDPETGTVRIYALEHEAERISETEIRLNAAEASLSLSATEAWVNEQISLAVLDPSQIPLVDDLQMQVNQVRVDLDAAEAELALSASQTEVDGMSARLSTAEADLDAAEAAIALKAEQSQYEDLQGRVQTAEVQIDALDGAQITQTVADTRHLLNSDDAAAVQTLANLLHAHEAGERVQQDIAYATQDLRARVNEDREAVAALGVTLGASIDNAVALVQAETLARAAADSALASDVVTLDARLEDAEGEISGQAQAQSQLASRVTSLEGTTSSQAQSITSLTARLTVAEDEQGDQATAVHSLTTRMSDAEGTITAQAQSLASLSTTVGTNTSTVQTVSESVDGVLGRHMLRVNVNGVATGMVIASEAGDDGAVSSTIAFAADAFTISAPSGAGAVSPFAVYTSGRTIGGIYYPAGVYLERAYIGQAAIGRGQITDTLQSDNYAEDGDGRPTAGLKLDFAAGELKAFGAVMSRDQVLASGSFTYGGQIGNGAVFRFVNTGIRVSSTDVRSVTEASLIVEAGIKTFSQAASGFDPNNSWWCAKCTLLNGPRWYGFNASRPQPAVSYRQDPADLVDPYWATGIDQRVWLEIEVVLEGIPWIENPTIEWIVKQVT